MFLWYTFSVQDSSHFLSYLFYVWLYQFSGFFIKTPRHGAQTTLYCCLEDKLEAETGLYYADVGSSEASKFGLIEENRKALWDLSEKLTETMGLKL